MPDKVWRNTPLLALKTEICASSAIKTATIPRRAFSHRRDYGEASVTIVGLFDAAGVLVFREPASNIKSSPPEDIP